jgi:hypothetical protein
MSERNENSIDDMLEPMMIVLPLKMIHYLEAHAKAVGITPSAVILGALSVYRLKEGARDAANTGK